MHDTTRPRRATDSLTTALSDTARLESTLPKLIWTATRLAYLADARALRVVSVSELYRSIAQYAPTGSIPNPASPTVADPA